MRAGVLGSPIRHSLSPVLHRAAYAELDLDWTYDAHEVDEAGLSGFLAGLDGSWGGLSLTMPLKRAVLPLLAELRPLARAVGAANTVVPLAAADDGLPLPLAGDNTDVPGMVAALRAAGVDRVERACVLGAGATASSALAALCELGERAPVVLARDVRRAGALREAATRLGVRPQFRAWTATLPRCDLLVATAPAGSTDGLANTLPAQVQGVLFDVVYDPWPTALATAWAARGGRIAGGLELLVQQAALQVEVLTGRPGPLPAMRAAGQAALRARATAAARSG